MLKLSEFWSARAHSEDFTLTRMGFMTVRLRLLTCLLMVGLLMLLGFMRLNATVTRRFKRGKLTPMPTALKYGGWR